MKEVMDLRPDRDLIDNDFSGYKLSLDSIPTYERSLDCNVDTILPGDDQYSLAHVKVFSLHNYLHFNPYTQTLAYFVDEKWDIHQVSINTMNRIEKIVKVYSIHIQRPRKPGDFPVSICFASKDRAVIGDGAGTFHVAIVQKDKWVTIFYDNTIPECSTIVAAHQENTMLHIVSQSVVEPKFETRLEWLTLDETWNTVSVRKFQVSGAMDYITIEPPNFMLIVCPSRPKLLTDSGEDSLDNNMKYQWSQTSKDITIIVAASSIVESDVKLELEGSHIHLCLKDLEIINGELAFPAGNPVWTLENNKLELVLQKSEEGTPWQEVIKGDVAGVQVQTEREDSSVDHPFNSEELEDVDVSSQSSLFRLNVNTKEVTHEVDISTSQFLFQTVVDPNKLPGICLRHLNDACVWQLENYEENHWKPTHVGTFSAFGYVQASKTQRKFIVAPQDLSYVTISDAFRHLYLFRQPTPINSDLRNRTSGVRVKAVAKQHLLNLEVNEEILGVRATNNHLLVLTKSRFFVLVINES